MPIVSMMQSHDSSRESSDLEPRRQQTGRSA
jgi:hypothetical protein